MWNETTTIPAQSYPYRVTTEFELPLDSDVLYLLARGDLAYGSVEVVDWVEGTNQVKVEVAASFHSQDALDRANVCAISRMEREHGVGIFTPKGWRSRHGQDQIHFDITVRIPTSKAAALTHVRGFETSLPIFSHRLSVSEHVVFGKLDVHGSNMGISATSLYAEHATLKTSNAPISGVFNTSTSLELVTSNAHIKAAVGLTSTQSGPYNDPTKLVMKTSNGPVNAVLSLLSKHDTGGTYDVSTETSNNFLGVTYDAASPGHTLVHRGRTSNAPATLSLHRAYEGPFALQSSNIPPNLKYDSDVEDPAGKGRTRWVEIHQRVKNVLSGAVGWGSDHSTGKGSVDLQTSNSPAQLVLL